MPKEQLTDLFKFMQSFPFEVQDRVIWLRSFVWDLYPQANELIYDNYNALAIGWSPTEKMGHIFCSVAIYRVNFNMHFGFYRGAELADPQQLLIGDGNQYRYLRVTDIASFPEHEVKMLIDEAWQNSLKKVKDPRQLTQGQTVTKAVSAAKREKKAAATKK